jgi:iron-regulated transporter 1
MRRIDLICKLAGPFFISIIDGVSTEIAILVNLGINIASVIVEYYAIARVCHETLLSSFWTKSFYKVYQMVPALQEPKGSFQDDTSEQTTEETSGAFSIWRHVKVVMLTTFRESSIYFQHRAFLPSFSGALLYFTVLSFAGHMITYLLSVGYNSIHIGVARTASVVFELSATWIAPKVMSGIGPIRSGLWFISWQMMCLAAGTGIFWGAKTPLVSAFGLVGGTILSRVGLWGFDLSVQVIVQEVCLEFLQSHKNEPSSD